MKTPYIPHLFGTEAHRKLNEKQGWLTAGVSSSIAWPQDDVWVFYDGHEYVLHGIKSDDEKGTPCLLTPTSQVLIEDATTRLYKFASILSWFKGGYVDLTGTIWGTRPGLFGSRDTYTTLLDGGKFFSCNYMPLIDDDQTRIALAFMREGRRLQHVNAAYSFLSFYKVIESQFKNPNKKIEWITKNIEQLENQAKQRVIALRSQSLDVSNHLYESGRCAVAHASLGGEIIDPDIPADRRRISEDLVIVAGLADRFIRYDLSIPDDRDVYDYRDRTEPWHKLLPEQTVQRLKLKENISNIDDLGDFPKSRLSVRLWPHTSPLPLQNMEIYVDSYGAGVITFQAQSDRKTIALTFTLDIGNGKLHAMLEESGLTEDINEVNEDEVEHFTRYFHSAIGNALIELCIEGIDPIPCEIIVPKNTIPQNPDKMVTEAVNFFRNRKKSLL
jgi:hypothetical protein